MFVLGWLVGWLAGWLAGWNNYLPFFYCFGFSIYLAPNRASIIIHLFSFLSSVILACVYFVMLVDLVIVFIVVGRVSQVPMGVCFLSLGGGRCQAGCAVAMSWVSRSVGICRYMSGALGICWDLSASVGVSVNMSASVGSCRELLGSVGTCLELSGNVGIRRVCRDLLVSVATCRDLSGSVSICRLCRDPSGFVVVVVAVHVLIVFVIVLYVFCSGRSC